jgi:hypothetical protein
MLLNAAACYCNTTNTTDTSNTTDHSPPTTPPPPPPGSLLNPCDLITFHQYNNTNYYRVMKVDRVTNQATLDRPYTHDPLQEDAHSFLIYHHDSIPNVQLELEQLALKKMKCTNLGCIDSIEIQEKRYWYKKEDGAWLFPYSPVPVVKSFFLTYFWIFSFCVLNLLIC